MYNDGIFYKICNQQYSIFPNISHSTFIFFHLRINHHSKLLFPFRSLCFFQMKTLFWLHFYVQHVLLTFIFLPLKIRFSLLSREITLYLPTNLMIFYFSDQLMLLPLEHIWQILPTLRWRLSKELNCFQIEFREKYSSLLHLQYW